MVMDFTIREITPKDDAGIERVIRDCLIEYGGDHEGTAWADPNLGRFSAIYGTEGNRYWVALDSADRVVAGAGIGAMSDEPGMCELQKMYCRKEYRGTGIAHRLMKLALDYAGRYYRSCYLETLENMIAAQKFYEKYGFVRIKDAIGQTGHFACDVRYRKELTE